MHAPLRFRFTVLGLVALAALLALLGGALAAKQTFHDRFITDIDPDNNCGVEGTTHLTVSQVGWLTFDPDGNVVAGKITGEVTWVFTADDGRSAIGHVAGPVFFSATDNGDGTVTFANTWKGLPEQIRGGGGGVATFDSGLLTLVQTVDFSGPEPVVVDRQVVEYGPHPEADADFAIFCDAFLTALG